MCKRPLVRIVELGEYVTAADGHKYPKAKVTSLEGSGFSRYEDIPTGFTPRYKYELIPCGRCIDCRFSRSRDWATRCMLEAKQYKENYFITLTYDDDHLPYNDTFVDKDGITWTDDGTWNGTLVPEHMQKFWKDLRRYYKYHYNHDGIRFYDCGEYGSQTQRPHYHAIAFNLPIPAEELKVYKIKDGIVYWNWEIMSKIWGKGFVVITDVSWSTCAYVARYIMKKQTGEMSSTYYGSRGQVPEFTNMSLKPGIGQKYYDEHKDEIYKSDSILMKTVKGSIGNVKPPRYYDKLYDIDYPSDMQKIKAARKAAAAEAQKMKLSKTSLDLKSQLAAEERSMVIKAKALVRPDI